MKDNRDAVLQGLFEEANMELSGDTFTPRVMAKTYSLRNRLLAVSAALVLILAIFTWLFELPLFGLVRQASQVFTFALFDLGEGWLAWILAPLNSIGGLLLLSAKAARVIHKKMIGAL